MRRDSASPTLRRGSCALCLAAALAAVALGACKEKPARSPQDEPSEADDEVRPIYDQKGPPLPLAVRLCQAVHSLPEERRAQCCASRPGIVLAGECAFALTAALRSRAVALEPARVDACAAALGRAYQGCGWVGPFGPAFPAECQRLFAGRRKAGEACRSSLECEGGASCAGVGPTDVGRCAPPGEAGASCATAVDALATFTRQDLDRLHPPCKGYCNRHRCAERAAPGAACATSLQCGPDGRCAAGHCAEGRAQPGESCSGGDCAAGLRCLEEKCFAPLEEGAACASDLDCRGGCLAADGGRRCGRRCDLR